MCLYFYLLLLLSSLSVGRFVITTFVLVFFVHSLFRFFFFFFIYSFPFALCRLILLQRGEPLSAERVCVLFIKPCCCFFSLFVCYYAYAILYTQTVVLCPILFHFRLDTILCVFFSSLGSVCSLLVFLYCFVLFWCGCMFFSVVVLMSCSLFRFFAHSHSQPTDRYSGDMLWFVI